MSPTARKRRSSRPVFATLLRDAMTRREVGVEQLVTLLRKSGCPVSRAGVYFWLRGPTHPVPATVAHLWDVLQVPPGERESWTRAMGLDGFIDAAKSSV